MEPKIANILFQLISSSIKLPIFSMLREFERNEKLSRDELEDLQWGKITKLIKYAYSRSSYYKKIFKELGAEPNDIKNKDDFKKLPLLTKNIIRKRKNEILASPRPRNLYRVKTSGSTGIPLSFFKDSTGNASTYAAMYRGHRWFGADIGAKEARLWSVPINNFGKFKIKSIDFLLNRIRQSNSEISDKIFKRFCNRLKRFRPQYLMGYPSLIYLFSRYLLENDINGKDFQLKFVKCTGETLIDFEKEMIESVFGNRCINEYGAAETGIISFECPARNHHIMDDCVFTEFTSNKIVHNALEKRIIVTNLYNYVFPIIRYDIGDVCYPVNGVCSCGKSFGLMSAPKGRVHDIIIGKNGKRFHSSLLTPLIKDLINENLPINQFQFVQAEPGKIQINIVKGMQFNTRGDEYLIRAFKNVFKQDIDINIKIADEIRRSPSGKPRYYVSHIAKK